MYGLHSFCVWETNIHIFFLQEMFKTLSKVSLYENIFTNHDSDSLDCNGHSSPPSYVIIYTVQKASWKKFVQQTAYKMSPNNYGMTGDMRFLKWQEWQTLLLPSPQNQHLQIIQNMNSSSSNIHHVNMISKGGTKIEVIVFHWSWRGQTGMLPWVWRTRFVHKESALQLYESTKLKSTVPAYRSL